MREKRLNANQLSVTLGLETRESGMISASVMEFPDCHVEAATREEAISKVQSVFLERLAHIETIPWDIPLPSTETDQTQSAGIFKTNAAFEDVMSRIQAERDAWGDEDMDVSEYMR